MFAVIMNVGEHAEIWWLPESGAERFGLNVLREPRTVSVFEKRSIADDALPMYVQSPLLLRRICDEDINGRKVLQECITWALFQLNNL